MRALPRRQRSHSCLESMGLWADARTGLYKRGCDPRAWGCCIFQPRSQPIPRGAPFLYERRFRRYAWPGFPKKKTGQFLGPGANPPGVSLHPFLHAEKGCGPRIRWPFPVGSRFFMRGRPAIPVFLVWPAGPTPFLGDKKGRKRTVRGFCRFSLSMKIDSNHTAKTNPYKKGARGPRIEAGLKLEPKG